MPLYSEKFVFLPHLKSELSFLLLIPELSWHCQNIFCLLTCLLCFLSVSRQVVCFHIMKLADIQSFSLVNEVFSFKPTKKTAKRNVSSGKQHPWLPNGSLITCLLIIVLLLLMEDKRFSSSCSFAWQCDHVLLVLFMVL